MPYKCVILGMERTLWHEYKIAPPHLFLLRWFFVWSPVWSGGSWLRYRLYRFLYKGMVYIAITCRGKVSFSFRSFYGLVHWRRVWNWISMWSWWKRGFVTGRREDPPFKVCLIWTDTFITSLFFVYGWFGI